MFSLPLSFHRWLSSILLTARVRGGNNGEICPQRPREAGRVRPVGKAVNPQDTRATPGIYTGVAQWRAPVSKTGGWGNRAFHPCQGVRSPELFSTNFTQRPPAATGGIYVAPVRMRAAVPTGDEYDQCSSNKKLHRCNHKRTPYEWVCECLYRCIFI